MSKVEDKKLISLRLDGDLHKKLKIIAVNEETSLQGYLMDLIMKDLKRREKANNEG